MSFLRHIYTEQDDVLEHLPTEEEIEKYDKKQYDEMYWKMNSTEFFLDDCIEGIEYLENLLSGRKQEEIPLCVREYMQRHDLREIDTSMYTKEDCTREESWLRKYQDGEFWTCRNMFYRKYVRFSQDRGVVFDDLSIYGIE